MTTFSQATASIFSHFVTEWGVETPVSLDNEKDDLAQSQTHVVGTEWVRLNVRHAFRSQTSMGGTGNRRFTSLGVAFVSIFTPIDAGRARADELVERVLTIFEGKTLSSSTVSFREVTPREIPRDEGYYLVVVEANFEYQEVK